MDGPGEYDSDCSTFKTPNCISNDSLIYLFVDYIVSQEPGIYSPDKTIECVKVLKSKALIQMTPFQSTVKNKLNHLLPILLACNDDVNYVDNRGQTILHIFVFYYTDKTISRNATKDKEIVQTLIEKGASVNSADFITKNTPVHYAASNHRIDLVNLMLDNFTNVNVQDNYGGTVLHYLLYKYSEKPDDLDIEIIRKLISKGATVEEPKDKHEMSPVGYAVACGSMKILQIFQINDKRLLFLICKNISKWDGHSDELQNLDSLIDLRKCLQVRDKKNHWTALHYVTHAGKVDMVKMFLNAGADIDAQSEDGITPLHLAVFRGHFEIVQLLVERGANLRARDTVFDFGLMHMTAFKGDKYTIKFLLEQGLNLEDRGADGFTPLHWAALMGDVFVIKSLILQGSNVNCRTYKKQLTPLHLIFKTTYNFPLLVDNTNRNSWINQHCHGHSWKDRKDAVLLLIQFGANPNARDVNFQTPLLLATTDYIFSNNSVGLLTILEYGARVDVKDANNNSALRNTLNHFKLHGLTELLRYGADLNEIIVPPRLIDDHCRLRNYLKLMKRIGLPIKEDCKYLLDSSELEIMFIKMKQPSDYVENCRKEIEKMKTHYASDGQTTLYDYLHMDTKRRCHAAHSILSIDLASEYPIFQIVIENSCRLAINQKIIIDLASTALKQIANFKFPDTCTEIIFSYMSKLEMTTFIDIVESLIM